jgi:hypothetical protein
MCKGRKEEPSGREDPRNEIEGVTFIHNEELEDMSTDSEELFIDCARL